MTKGEKSIVPDIRVEKTNYWSIYSGKVLPISISSVKLTFGDCLWPFLCTYFNTLNGPRFLASHLRSQPDRVKARLIIRPNDENVIFVGLVWGGDKG